ncbi:lipopolysaccharide core biosynthesis protein [Pseudomonas sp. PDM19]|uniref:lipopolysaccharide core biosynthesis protein n=1 Tax=Pseudomonas sp. PDM19 TaxID=2769272 RepID=UPI001786F307|nr:lipopolysaccharide core biosynthesis protein [Pseudomonas sp. PDM19]MBD9633300.1 lipopolysaccharide core biosynthesis protein [Pseudomonas sp. PDM19]
MLELKQEGGRRWLGDGSMQVPLAEFGECRGRYQGSVFLLASGPSAGEFPLARYADWPVIAMNGSIVRCVDQKITPFFYICDDPGFVRDRPDLACLGARSATHLAMSLNCFQALHRHDPALLPGRANVFLLERVNRRHGMAVLSDRSYAWSVRRDPDLICGFSLLRRKTNRIGFSRNMSKGYFGGRTIPYAATQLACHLGFSQVFIIGMDLNKSIGRFYETGTAALPSSLDEDFEDYILPSFRIVAEKVSPRFPLRLFNLSPDSRLPASVVPKVEPTQLDALLEAEMAATGGKHLRVSS